MTESSARKTTFTDWANRQARPERAGLEQRRKLWEALNEFIHLNGGWVVSPPGEKVLRIEVMKGSSLPTKLTELGYEVQTLRHRLADYKQRDYRNTRRAHQQATHSPSSPASCPSMS